MHLVIVKESHNAFRNGSIDARNCGAYCFSCCCYYILYVMLIVDKFHIIISKFSKKMLSHQKLGEKHWKTLQAQLSYKYYITHTQARMYACVYACTI